jgi:hypothetical protein
MCRPSGDQYAWKLSWNSLLSVRFVRRLPSRVMTHTSEPMPPKPRFPKPDAVAVPGVKEDPPRPGLDDRELIRPFEAAGQALRFPPRVARLIWICPSEPSSRRKGSWKTTCRGSSQSGA